MEGHPLFVSVICVVEDAVEHIEKSLVALVHEVGRIARDFEIVVVDNGSTDDTLGVLKRLTQETDLPNVQVYAMTKRIDHDAAAWHGIESALGDVFAVFDPVSDDIAILSEMLDFFVAGADVVYAINSDPEPAPLPYRVARWAFEVLLRRLGGVDYARDAPAFRLMNRRVVAFIGRQRDPANSYRVLPGTAGFVRKYVHYASRPMARRRRGFGEAFDRGLQLLVSTTRVPMRLVSILALFGAGASLTYSFYVVILSFFRDDLAEGWVSLSLMSSGMFFLISMVLMVLGEYVIHGSAVSRGRDPVDVSQEFNSRVLVTRERLNVESVEARDLFDAYRVLEGQ